MDDFSLEVTINYKNEKYSVRDNGSVLRHQKENSTKPRPLDNKWTFGKVQENTGYLNIAGERVHRIVAIAFHGEPEDSQLIVDHIDTNRQNNRKENLRWVTKLENALNNPITRKRIILLCGSIESFLENPSQLKNSTIDNNFQWMRNVTPEEARISKERLLEWAESDKEPKGGQLGEWIFQEKAYSRFTQQAVKEKYVPQSLTSNVRQVDWNTPSEFLKCPTEVTPENLIKYYESLSIGDIFVRNRYGENEVVHKALTEDKNNMLIITDLDSPIKNYALAKVYIEEGFYVHKSMGTFFTEEGALKQFTLAQGLEWDGEDSIDDYT
ncbi:MAG: HNH endonuclease signature motif containing protein [Candidatus Izemoplasmatales bacterium]|nr:HNH endonuclease signature motif containing protein [Candidatus Izemoplasmatales bacterium]